MLAVRFCWMAERCVAPDGMAGLDDRTCCRDQALTQPENKEVAEKLGAVMNKVRALPKHVTGDTAVNGTGDSPANLLGQARMLAMQVKVSVAHCMMGTARGGGADPPQGAVEVGVMQWGCCQS